MTPKEVQSLKIGSRIKHNLACIEYLGTIIEIETSETTRGRFFTVQWSDPENDLLRLTISLYRENHPLWEIFKIWDI